MGNTNGQKANQSDEKQKKRRQSKLALQPEEVHEWLTVKIQEVYGVRFDVDDFKKNNGMVDLLGNLQPVKK